MKWRKSQGRNGIWNEQSIRLAELQKNNERYQMIIDQLESTIFEYCLADGSITYGTNCLHLFSNEPDTMHFPKSALDWQMVHPEDMESFQQMFEKIRNGTPHCQGEFRLKNTEGCYLWYSFKITAIFDENKIPVRAIGQISDITCQKQEIQELMQKAQHDELTGLLNKAATQHFVENSLLGSATCALYVIDVDHFKSINDSLGHMFGDTVLAEVGGCLKRLFRASDIIGRIGGDEFMVFMKDIGDPSLICEKADALNECLNQTFCSQTGIYTISGSIGVAVYPKDGSSYADLYKKADIALYNAKRCGRNSCVIFEDEMEDEEFSTVFSDFSAKLPPVLSNPPQNRKTYYDNLLPYLFDLLYQAKDITNVIRIVLKIIGEHFDVNHIYILENAQDDLCASITYEWCADGTTSLCNDNHSLSYSDFDHFQEYFVDGIFYCRNIEGLQEPLRTRLRAYGIQSILQFAILDECKFRGCIGFGKCDAKRLWTQEKIDALSSISGMIGIFLIKSSVSSQLITAYESSQTILDTWDGYAYVVDRKTYRILYANKKALSNAAFSASNNRCYTILGNGITPCADCPMNCASADFPVCINHYLIRQGVWSSATALQIHWQGNSNAVLIRCREISNTSCQ